MENDLGNIGTYSLPASSAAALAILDTPGLPSHGACAPVLASAWTSSSTNNSSSLVFSSSLLKCYLQRERGLV